VTIAWKIVSTAVASGSAAAAAKRAGIAMCCWGYPQTVSERTALVRCARLCGVFAWEVSQDSNDHALVDEIATLL
jgi:chitinase